MSENLEKSSILLSSPQALVQITSFELALICLRREFCIINISSDFKIRMPDFNVDDVLKVTLPRHIPGMINRHIKLIASQLISWIKFHYTKIFHAYRVHVILKCLDCIVCRSDGKICYQSTARNLLASDGVNLEEKYRIACIYCFKEDIDRMWPLVMGRVSISDFTIQAQYADCFQQELPFLAVNFWNCVKKNGDIIVRSDLLRCTDMYPPAKVEFYWNTSNFPETWKLNAVVEIFRNEDLIIHDVVKFLMSKLSLIGQKYLLTLMATELIPELALEDFTSCNCSLQVWKHVKEFVTNDQFSNLLHSLWVIAFLTTENCGYGAVILHKIWTTAPEHLRDFILNTHVAVFFDELEIPFGMKTYGYDMGFYINVLCNLNPDQRLKLWSENWRKFICLATVPNLDKMMKLCLADENAVVSFKNNVMTDYTAPLESDFMTFIKAGLYEELFNYLEFVCTDTTQVQKIQQQLLTALLGDVLFFSEVILEDSLILNICVKFNEFVDRAFPLKYLANNFKMQLIMYNFEYLRPILMDGEYLLHEMRKWATYLGSHNDICANELKKISYKICQEVLMDGEFINFDVTSWRLFLEWCAPSEEEILRFKNSLPLDKIFAIYLKRVIKGQKERRLSRTNTLLVDYYADWSPNYISFNYFLKWYLGSDEAVDNLKRSKIGDYRNVEEIKAILNGENIEIIFDMLKWFFNNDINQAKTFFNSFVRAKITLLRELL